MGTTYSKPESLNEKARGTKMFTAEVKREQITDIASQACETRSSFLFPKESEFPLVYRIVLVVGLS